MGSLFVFHPSPWFHSLLQTFERKSLMFLLLTIWHPLSRVNTFRVLFFGSIWVTAFPKWKIGCGRNVFSAVPCWSSINGEGKLTAQEERCPVLLAAPETYSQESLWLPQGLSTCQSPVHEAQCLGGHCCVSGGATDFCKIATAWLTLFCNWSPKCSRYLHRLTWSRLGT